MGNMAYISYPNISQILEGNNIYHGIFVLHVIPSKQRFSFRSARADGNISGHGSQRCNDYTV